MDFKPLKNVYFLDMILVLYTVVFHGAYNNYQFL